VTLRGVLYFLPVESYLLGTALDGLEEKGVTFTIDVDAYSLM
jgi:hypothetical protein